MGTIRVLLKTEVCERLMQSGELLVFTRNRKKFDTTVRLDRAGLRQALHPENEYPRVLLDVVLDEQGYVMFTVDGSADCRRRSKNAYRERRKYGLFGEKERPLIRFDNSLWEIYWPCTRATIDEKRAALSERRANGGR